MNHHREWVPRVAAGFEAQCSCGWRRKHGSGEAVRTLHQVHARDMGQLAGLRAILDEKEQRH